MRGKLALDPQRHECTWDGKPVRLTVTEFLILQALAQRPGFVKSRDSLMDAAYDDQVYVDDRHHVDSHIKLAAQEVQGGGRRLRRHRDAVWRRLPLQRIVPHFSALTWRILGFNALALIVLTAGVILVQFSGRDLVEERFSGVQQQAAIVASAIAEYASDQETSTLNLDAAEPLLRQLISPTRLRARVYLVSNNTAALDTRFLLRRNTIITRELPALNTGSQIKTWIRRVYDGAMGVRPFAELAPYSEGSGDWHNYQEVVNAFFGRLRPPPSGWMTRTG